MTNKNDKNHYLNTISSELPKLTIWNLVWKSLLRRTFLCSWWSWVWNITISKRGSYHLFWYFCTDLMWFDQYNIVFFIHNLVNFQSYYLYCKHIGNLQFFFKEYKFTIEKGHFSLAQMNHKSFCKFILWGRNNFK